MEEITKKIRATEKRIAALKRRNGNKETALVSRLQMSIINAKKAAGIPRKRNEI